MTLTIIKSKTGKILHQGHFDTLKDCLEDAIQHSKPLNGLDLSFQNLANANMDGLLIENADFNGCNLMGANLSECTFKNTSFDNAILHGTCMAYSTLDHCSFTGALFGGTDIQGCTIKHTLFTSLSALQLNFTDADCIAKCIYRNEISAEECIFEQQPVMLPAPHTTISIFETHIKIGNLVRTPQDWINTPEHHAIPVSSSEKDTKTHDPATLFHTYRNIIMTIFQSRPPMTGQTTSEQTEAT